ncbi:MAG TPA: MarR family transcriptional regulator [Candidatus Angelobacter sp.]|nr:MarR family transcriptional regulator [Candidatus Angelobacter sp.]
MPRDRSLEELADRLHSTAIHLLRMVRVRDAETGIGPARLSALSVVVFGGPISLNDLARAEQVKPPTMSRIVDGLEEAGLVARSTNASDRRGVVIEATAEGKAMLQEGRRRRVRMLAARLAQLPKAELASVNRAIDAIQKALASKSG